VLESLTDVVSGSPWTYAFLFAVSALDAIIPLVPSETSVIAAGVLASSGDLVLGLVILCAAAGAILGDNTSYAIGRTAGHRIAERVFVGTKHKRLEQAERGLAERGGYLIVVARFIPGGRTAVTLAAGTLEYPWRRFIAFDTLAGFIWASYAACLGYFGGKTFEESPLKGLALAFGVAFGVAVTVEVVRWIRRRRTQGPAAESK
jgi:membrane protein DedA with SNARE-associated domain